MAETSEKLSKILGQPVQVNIKDGETLEQAETRVMQERPDLFGKASPAEDFGNAMALPSSDPKSKTMNDFQPSERLLQLENQKNSTNPTSKNYGNLLRAFNEQLEFEKSQQGIIDPTKIKKATPPKFSDKMLEKIQSIKSAQGSLEKLLELKNSGFGGQGIDTGPIVGGEYPNPFGMLGEDAPNILPAALSEWWNSNLGEHAGDRGLLRQQQLELLNPVRKTTTGAQASEKELSGYILPAVPNESDNDKTFFKKGLNSAGKSQQDLIDILTTLQKAGVDVSQFKNDMSVTPDSFVSRLIQGLSANPKGSFTTEFPQGVKDVPGVDLQAESGQQDQEALTWAKQNPGDPRAQAILQRLGAQ